MKSCTKCYKSNNCNAWQNYLNSFPDLDEEKKESLAAMVGVDCKDYKRVKVVTVYPTSCRECPHCQEEGSENTYRGIYYVCYESDPTGSKGIEIKGNEWELQSWCKLKDFKEDKK